MTTAVPSKRIGYHNVRGTDWLLIISLFEIRIPIYMWIILNSVIQSRTSVSFNKEGDSAVEFYQLTCTACQYGAASATGVVATEHPGPKKTILCGGVSIISSMARIPVPLSHLKKCEKSVTNWRDAFALPVWTNEVTSREKMAAFSFGENQYQLRDKSREMHAHCAR